MISRLFPTCSVACIQYRKVARPLLVLVFLPLVCEAKDSSISMGTASFDPPGDCRSIPLDVQVVQACHIRIEANHGILITLREAWERAGPRDATGVARSVDNAMAWPKEYAEGMRQGLNLAGREKLLSFKIEDAEPALTPEAAVTCVKYSYEVEDRFVPNFPGKLFVREEHGLLCGAGAPGEDGIYVHETWLSVSERYSPDLGQTLSADSGKRIVDIFVSFDLGYK